jgi:hypothetical protein
MKELFEIASGSVIGRSHLLAEKNNQDAFTSWQDPNATIALVCDGCSSGKHSEVGAKLASQLLITALIQRTSKLTDPKQADKILEMARQDVLAQLRLLALALGQDFKQIVNDYFLFTIVGALITPQLTVLFNLGDGLAIINNEIFCLGPFANNEPPYLGYQLLSSSLDKNYNFQLIKIMPTAEVQSILIGTDGTADLNKAENKLIPGKKELVGNLSQFWENDLFFKNPDMLRRKLWQINRSISMPDWLNRTMNKENGHLLDDTTIIVLRRKPIPKE